MNINNQESQSSMRRQIFSEFRELLLEKNLFNILVFLRLLFVSLVKGRNSSTEARILHRLVRVPNSGTKWQFAKFVTENLINSHSADYQDLIVSYFTENTKEDCTFLELGAVDGVYKSNCALLEKVGWQGIAVEANPNFAKDFHENRKCKLITRAVVTQNQVTEDFLLYFSPGLATSGHLSTSNSKESQETIKVDLITVNQLIMQWGSQFGDAPTYLSVDIEGLDLFVVTEMLTFGFKPTIISMEHNFRIGELEKIDSLAKKFGYKEIYKGLCRNEVILALTDARFPRLLTELMNDRP